MSLDEFHFDSYCGIHLTSENVGGQFTIIAYNVTELGFNSSHLVSVTILV